MSSLNSCHICHLQLCFLLVDLAFALGNSFNYRRTFLHWGDDDDDGRVAETENESEADVAKTRRPKAGQVFHHIFAPPASFLDLLFFANAVELEEKKTSDGRKNSQTKFVTGQIEVKTLALVAACKSHTLA